MRRWWLYLACLMVWQTPAAAQPAAPCIAMVGTMSGDTTSQANAPILEGSGFKDARSLADAVGDGAIIQGGNFSGWDFRGLRLGNACFVDADLKRSVWNDADTPGIGFINSDLSHSTLTGIKATGILLRDAKLSNVKADKADFSNGVFEGGWFDSSIDGWNIDGADLAGFSFLCGITLPDGCPVYAGEKGISARGTDFSRAKLSSFRRYGFIDIDISGATFDHTELSPGQLTSLAGHDLHAPVFLVGSDAIAQVSPSDVVTLIADAAAFSKALAGPAFSCEKAASPTEKLLCAGEGGDLAGADRQLSMLFGQVRALNPSSVAAQRQWLKQRDACMIEAYPADCLRGRYSERTGVLLGQLGERGWLGRGESALFIDDELPLSDAARNSALFGKIAPVLAAASMTVVVVTRQSNGQYSVVGNAMGANAHTCSLGAQDMQMDPANGWYSVRQPDGKASARVLRVIGDRLEVFGSGHPDSAAPEATMDYASCGVRAAFAPLRRILVQREVMEKYVERASIEY